MLFSYFAGLTPRVLWITLGGFIYFGAYEKAKLAFEEKCKLLKKSIQTVRGVAPSYMEERFEKFRFSKEGRCELEIKDNKVIEEESKRNEPEDLNEENIVTPTLLKNPSDVTI